MALPIRNQAFEIIPSQMITWKPEIKKKKKSELRLSDFSTLATAQP